MQTDKETNYEKAVLIYLVLKYQNYEKIKNKNLDIYLFTC